MAMICSGKFLLFLFSPQKEPPVFEGPVQRSFFSMAKDVRTKRNGNFHGEFGEVSWLVVGPVAKLEITTAYETNCTNLLVSVLPWSQESRVLE